VFEDVKNVRRASLIIVFIFKCDLFNYFRLADIFLLYLLVIGDNDAIEIDKLSEHMSLSPHRYCQSICDQCKEIFKRS
jgi:hypothetical protein